MSPRSGGEADKVGNAYEMAWIISHLMQVLAGTADSIAVERGEFDIDGVEFSLRRGTAVEVHQVKRQSGTSDRWTFSALDSKRVFATALAHAGAGREYHFVSTVPARVLQELSDRARGSSDLRDFVARQLTSRDLTSMWDDLCRHDAFDSPDDVWVMLRHFKYRLIDHHELDRTNDAFASMLFDGTAGALAGAGLSRLVMESLGLELGQQELGDRLPELSLRLRSLSQRAQAESAVRASSQRWLRSIEATLLDPRIPRAEADQIVQCARSSKVSFVVGRAGWGKSGAVAQSVTTMLDQGLPVLALRLDRAESYATTGELGARVGLSRSPVLELALAAGDQPSVLVVDQLDAVSLASGRMPRGFDVVSDLVAEAEISPQMSLVFVCREYDLDNDERFRALKARFKAPRVDIPLLSINETQSAVTDLGYDPSSFSANQIELLRSPLHLHLLQGITQDYSAWRTTSDLLEAFWERKKREVLDSDRDARFTRTIEHIALAMSDLQQLSIGEETLEQDGYWRDVLRLEAEGVLVRDSGQVAFFHEAFFDYAFARAWVRRGETLNDFLVASEQELFVRAQIRQALTFLRTTDVQRYRAEFLALIGAEGVRFHAKEAALSTLFAIDDASTEDYPLVLAAWENEALSRRVGQVHRNPNWARVFHDVGALANWVSSSDPLLRERADLTILALSEALTDAALAYLHEVDGSRRSELLLRLAKIELARRSDAYRADLLSLMRSGEFSRNERFVWYAVEDCVKEDPVFGMELVRASLLEDDSAFALGPDGRLESLDRRDSGIEDILRFLADVLPVEFAELGVEVVRRASGLTAFMTPSPGVLRDDPHFSFRFFGSSPDRLSEVIFECTSVALRHAAGRTPESVRPLFLKMAGSDLESVTALLYEGVKGAPQRFAEIVVEALRDNGCRFEVGYSDSPVWISREILGSIGPFLSEDNFSWIEDQVRDYRLEGERLPFGRYAFALLSALPRERLSTPGARRLQEYERKFGEVLEPYGIRAGTFKSPISTERAVFMDDERWLSAMHSHLGEREDWGTFTGGAAELGGVLQSLVQKEPDRFAQLALRMDEQLIKVFGSRILLGLGQAETSLQSGSVFEAVEYMSSFRDVGLDRWLAFAIQRVRKDVPDRLIEVFAERAVSSPDPADDGVRFRSSSEAEDAHIENVQNSAINTARGSLVDWLATLVAEDVSGSRTSRILPILSEVARDPALPVRVVGCRLIHASMRLGHIGADAVARELLASEPELLAYPQAVWMAFSLAARDQGVVVEAMTVALESETYAVRKNAGAMIAFAAAEWARFDLLEVVLTVEDEATLCGVASMCAARILTASNPEPILRTLLLLLGHQSTAVRKEAIEVADRLIGEPLSKHRQIINTIIQSDSFRDALPDLDRLFKQTVDPIDEFVVSAVDRWIELPSGDHPWSGFGESVDLAELLIRALAQASSSTARAHLLDAVDRLLAANAYGVDSIIDAAER